MARSARLAPLPFFECAACGFQQRDAPVADHYAGDGYAADRALEFIGEGLADRRRDARVRLSFLAAHAPGGALLDVGAAGGAFVAEAAAAGYAARGIEPAPSFAAFAREALGVDVATVTLDGVNLPDAAFDVVTLWHVLEHVEAPLRALERVRPTLRPGGALALEVPNAGSGIARALGPAWGMLEPEVHVGQFTRTALDALLRRAGFAVRLLQPVSSLVYGGALRPGAIVHRLKWRGTEPELLRAVASVP